MQELEKIRSKNFFNFFRLLKSSSKPAFPGISLSRILHSTVTFGSKTASKIKKGRFFPCTLHSTYYYCKSLKELISVLQPERLQKSSFQEGKTGRPKAYKIVEAIKLRLITYSISPVKPKYTHTWKTIFQDVCEKSNLLVRLVNYKEFSYPKVLQTSTI